MTLPLYFHFMQVDQVAYCEVQIQALQSNTRLVLQCETYCT